MTAGFHVINPNYSTIVDEEHPVYFIPPYSIRQVINFNTIDRVQNVGRNSDNYPSIYHFNSKVTLTITFNTPITAIARPLLFLSQAYPKNKSYSRITVYGTDPIWADWTWDSGRSGKHDGWLNNIVYTYDGVPGRWTGITITLTAYHSVREKRNYRTYTAISNKINAAMPDFRQYFMPGAAGGTNTIRGAGIMLWDGDTRIIFNTNDTLLDVKSVSSNWTYMDRQPWDGVYIEYWQNDSIPTSASDWFLVIPRQSVRRYNNEIGTVMMASIKASTRPMRMIIGGRSGSPAHTPAMWVRPTKAIPRTLR